MLNFRLAGHWKPAGYYDTTEASEPYILIIKEKHMTSRTAEGKHTKRFIIEVSGSNGKWIRSGNRGLLGFFSTREEANLALATGVPSPVVQYKVRQK